MLIRGQPIGASRGHETARRAVHESPRARDTKAGGTVVETRKRFAPRSNSQLAVAKDAGLRISWIIADLRLGDRGTGKEEKEFRIKFPALRPRARLWERPVEPLGPRVGERRARSAVGCRRFGVERRRVRPGVCAGAVAPLVGIMVSYTDGHNREV